MLSRVAASSPASQARGALFGQSRIERACRPLTQQINSACENAAGGARETNRGGDQRETVEIDITAVRYRHLENVERAARSARAGGSIARSAGRSRQFREQSFRRTLRFRPHSSVPRAKRGRSRRRAIIFTKARNVF